MPDTGPVPQPDFQEVQIDSTSQKSKDDEVWPLMPTWEETIHLAQTNYAWKIHCIVAAVLWVGSFISWVIVTWILPMFAWFTWAWGAILASLAIHYFMFIRPKQHFYLHLSLYVILSVNLMTTWLYSGTQYFWFIIPVLALGHFVNIHYQLVQKKSLGEKLFRMHQISFALLHAMLFFVWIQTDRSFPWFLIVFFATGFLYLIHYSLFWYPRNYFRLHCFLFADMQLMFFTIWAATQGPVPWFIFPLSVWGILLFVHYKLDKRSAKQPLLPQTSPVAKEMQPRTVDVQSTL